MPASHDPNYYAHRYNAVEDRRRIRLLDSTLREGEQHPGISFTKEQRLQIARRLDAFGIDQIEISPMISQDHTEATKAIVKEALRADIIAHGRALPADVDKAIDCDVTWVAVYLSVSDLHLAEKLRITREEALARALVVVEYIRAHGLKARFTMEDASRADPAFLVEMCHAVSQRGIERISLPDTVGLLRPRGMYNLVKKAHDALHGTKTALDVHCHNDLGLALANALAGCEAGADQIHVSIDGYGERVGIPSLAETAVVLSLLHGQDDRFQLGMLRSLSETLSQYTGLPMPASKPLVGEDAFKHKAGTHVAAVLKNPAAYEILAPKTVGNRRRIVLGPLAGKEGVAHLLTSLGLQPDAGDIAFQLRALKELGKGDRFELTLDEEE
jgi:isopropylmalate/homocitrate/citramalate synthase